MVFPKLSGNAKWIVLAALTAFLTVALLGGCSGPESKGPIDIIISGNLMGTVAPCNCPKNRSGGLPRRATAIQQLELPANMRLTLDAGNFAAIRRDIGDAKTEILLTGLTELGLDAISPGYRDLNRGAELYIDLAKRLNVPFVSANITLTKSGEHPFPGHRIIRLGGGIAVAVIGIADGGPFRQLNDSAGITFEDPAKALRRELAKIPGNVGMIILLTDADPKRVREWLQVTNDRKKIDLIVSGNNRNFSRDLQTVLDIPFAPCSRQGRFFDRLTAEKGAAGKWSFERISLFLGKKVPNDPEMVKTVKRLQEKLGLTNNQIGDLNG